MNSIKRIKFNVSLLGETQVGKTSMITVKSGLQFNENQLATVGIDNFTDKAQFDNKEYKFKIFDTAGQERYNSISAQTIKVADGFILVFSVDDKTTLEKIRYWIKSIEDNVNIKEKSLILVGNKIDMKRQITPDEGSNFAKEYNLKYFETSAKTGVGINECFNEIYKDIYDKNKKLEGGNPNDGENNEKNNIKLEKKKKDKKSKDENNKPSRC